MKSFSVAGYQFDKELLTETFYQNGCSQICQGRCCQGSVYMSGEEMDRVYSHLEGINNLLRPLTRGPEKWFVFDEDVLDNSRPGTPKVCGGPAVEDHPNLTDVDFMPSFAYERNGPHFSACIFLTLDRRCALQQYSEQMGQPKWRLKPFYCWLYPLTAKAGIITIDERAYGLCFQPGPTKIPIHTLVKEELIYLIGEEGYAEIIKRTAALEPDWQI